MSSFRRETLNPETMKVELADWLDDYFGRHKYGVMFPSGKVFSSDEVYDAEEKMKKNN